MAVSGVVDTIVGRAVRDQDFRARFLDAPVAAATEAGYQLSDDDRDILAALNGDRASAFFQKMEAEGIPMAWCSDHTCYEVEKEVP